MNFFSLLYHLSLPMINLATVHHYFVPKVIRVLLTTCNVVLLSGWVMDVPVAVFPYPFQFEP